MRRANLYIVNVDPALCFLFCVWGSVGRAGGRCAARQPVPASHGLMHSRERRDPQPHSTMCNYGVTCGSGSLLSLLRVGQWDRVGPCSARQLLALRAWSWWLTAGHVADCPLLNSPQPPAFQSGRGWWTCGCTCAYACAIAVTLRLTCPDCPARSGWLQDAGADASMVEAPRGFDELRMIGDQTKVCADVCVGVLVVVVVVRVCTSMVAGLVDGERVVMCEYVCSGGGWVGLGGVAGGWRGSGSGRGRLVVEQAGALWQRPGT